MFSSNLSDFKCLDNSLNSERTPVDTSRLDYLRHFITIGIKQSLALSAEKYGKILTKFLAN